MLIALYVTVDNYTDRCVAYVALYVKKTRHFSACDHGFVLLGKKYIEEIR